MSWGGEVGLKKERMLRDVRYSATGADPLTEQFKKEFDVTFAEFFKMAYAR
jgi:hypothetical protein